MTDPDRSRKLRNSVRGPLSFSTVLALIAAVVTIVAATGGIGREASNNIPRTIRFDLGLIAFGITFVVCLVFCAMLSMSHKENAEHLGCGSGVNLRSEDRLPGRTDEAVIGGQQAEARGESRMRPKNEGTEEDLDDPGSGDLDPAR